MSRSNWKGPYTGYTYEITDKNQKNLKSKLQILPRNYEILPKFVGMTFKIHNGKKFNEITVTEEMIGHKFGEFSFTRGRFSFKKKSKK